MATTDGRPYYQNTVTKQTSWNKPADWAEHGAAAPSTETAAAAQGTERDGAAEARIPGGVAGELRIFVKRGGVCDLFSQHIGARRVALAYMMV